MKYINNNILPTASGGFLFIITLDIYIPTRIPIFFLIIQHDNYYITKISLFLY